MSPMLAPLAALAALCGAAAGGAAATATPCARFASTLAPVAQDRKQAPQEIAWVEAKLDTALERARKRNVPLVVFACLAGETHNEEYRRHLGGNATLARALLAAVPMYASNGEPPPGAALVRHKELMDEVYNRWVAEHTPDGSWPLPEVLVVRPDGQVAVRLGSGHTVPDDEVVDALEDLGESLGGGVTDAEVAQLEGLCERARGAADRKDWLEAWRAWRGVLAITGAGPFAAEAKESLPPVEVEFRKLVEAAAEGVDESNVAARYATLRDVQRRSQGSSMAELAQKLATGIERDKRFKKLLPALRLEEEAEDLLFEVEALLSKDDDAGALKVLKRLAAKKYAPTAAQARALRVHGGLLD